MRFLRPSLNWLLVAFPAAIILEWVAPEAHGWIFGLSCVGIIPLAGWMGKATEHLASHTSEGIGGLLNATFGNAAELIIALMALRAGLFDVVKASLTGSIIGNILLVMGLAFLAGGVRFKEQKFNVGGARMQSTMLLLAAIALILPAAFHHLGGPEVAASEADLSLEIALILLLTYGAGLVFALHTHKDYFASHSGENARVEEDGREPWPLRRSLTVLIGATACIAWLSEVMVGSIEPAAQQWGLTNLFVGVIVVAIVGNAAEHSTAVLVAVKNRMDLSLTIALGSSIQIALFVAPLLVLVSYLIAPQPMDLVFSPVEVLAILLAVFIASEIPRDGNSNWLEGVQLLVVYSLLALVFYFLPGDAVSAH